MSEKTFQTKMQVGLGEAMKRLNLLHVKVRNRIASEEEKSEHDLLMEALDNIKIDLGFDCDGDDVPDTIEIFTKTAKTSCCRLVELDKKKPKRRRTSSRRKK